VPKIASAAIARSESNRGKRVARAFIDREPAYRSFGSRTSPVSHLEQARRRQGHEADVGGLVEADAAVEERAYHGDQDNRGHERRQPRAAPPEHDRPPTASAITAQVLRSVSHPIDTRRYSSSAVWRTFAEGSNG
jgi:hypothetical protein